MWETQKDDGSWNWLKCGWAPMEIDDHYGVTLAALAVGVAPGDYSKSQQAMIGINRLRTFLNANPNAILAPSGDACVVFEANRWTHERRS